MRDIATALFIGLLLSLFCMISSVTSCYQPVPSNVKGNLICSYGTDDVWRGTAVLHGEGLVSNLDGRWKLCNLDSNVICTLSNTETATSGLEAAP